MKRGINKENVIDYYWFVVGLFNYDIFYDKMF